MGVTLITNIFAVKQAVVRREMLMQDKVKAWEDDCQNVLVRERTLFAEHIQALEVLNEDARETAKIKHADACANAELYFAEQWCQFRKKRRAMLNVHIGDKYTTSKFEEDYKVLTCICSERYTDRI
jgi:hypothetical protein